MLSTHGSDHEIILQIDLLPWLTRTALELVAQSGFGYSFDTLEPDAREHPFAKTLKNLLCVLLCPSSGQRRLDSADLPPHSTTTSDPGLVAARNLIFPYVYNLGTPRFQRAVVNALPWKKLHELRDMVDLTHKTSLEILEATRRAVGNGGNKEERIAGGKDIMTCLRALTTSHPCTTLTSAFQSWQTWKPPKRTGSQKTN
jgi:hypothetical protein